MTPLTTHPLMTREERKEEEEKESERPLAAEGGKNQGAFTPCSLLANSQSDAELK